jgi:hypothetical protein
VIKLGSVICALVVFPLVSSAQTSGIDPAIARAYFAEIRQLGASDNGQLWGRSIAGPMMFVDAQSRTVIANERDAQGLLREDKGLWIGTLPSDINPANTSQKFGGRLWSMVVWPVSDNRYARARLLLHESFHRIQDSLGIPAFSPANAHMVSADARIMTRLEWRALTEALLNSGAKRKQALADALTFRARRQSLAPGAAEEERKLELNEGLAEYTGLVLSGLPRSALYDRAAVSLGQAENGENLSRSFAYASGPAYGLLLDDAGRGWRKRLLSSADIAEIARVAYAIPAVNAANADKLVDRYAGARMIADERARETKRLARESSLRTKFTSGARLKLPIAGSFSFSFDPNAVLPVKDLGTVYRGARVTDKWGILEVDGDVLFEKRADGAITGVVLSNPVVAGDSIRGDGWKLVLAQGWVVGPGQAPEESTVVEKK